MEETPKFTAPCASSSFRMWVLSPILSLWSARTTGVLPFLASSIPLATPSLVLGIFLLARGSRSSQTRSETSWAILSASSWSPFVTAMTEAPPSGTSA